MARGTRTDEARPSAREGGPGDGGFWGRWASRLTQSPEQAEAEELRRESVTQGGKPMCDVVDRDTATVCGAVKAVTLPPRTTVPAMVVDLSDGTRTVHLVWLGRRRIGGIEPGVRLRATGRITHRRGVPTIFNPAYEILPKHGH